jgi:hypothetical protein
MPRDDEHVAVFGRNGTGKTQASVWQLSERSFDKMPWVVINSKDDELINRIPGTFDLDLDDGAPRWPGIYVVRSAIADKEEKDELNGLLARIWSRQKTGIYFDEASDATGLSWFRRCLRQGRSRRVPIIAVTQRPLWLDRYVWSEASFYQGFQLNLADDRETADRMVPHYKQVHLPPFHSLWHDVKAPATFRLLPVPDQDAILQRFRERLPVKRRAI